MHDAEGLAVGPFRLELTRAEDIAALIAHLRRRLGRVDVLVNKSGLYLEYGGASVRDRTSAFDAQLQVVRALWEANLFGPFALSQGLVATMRLQG